MKLIKYFSIILIVSLLACNEEDPVGFAMLHDTPVAPQVLEIHSRVLNCVAPYPAEFSHTSDRLIGTETFLWNFGNEETSNTEKPFVILDELKVYNVSLTVTNEIGSHTLNYSLDLREGEIEIISEFEFERYLDNRRAPCLVNFYNYSDGVSIFNWDFGNGATSSNENPFFEYTEPGSYTISLDAVCSDGSYETSTALIEVYDAPENILIQEIKVWLEGVNGLDLFCVLVQGNTQLGATKIFAGVNDFPVLWDVSDDWGNGTPQIEDLNFLDNETFTIQVIDNISSSLIKEFDISTRDWQKDYYPTIITKYGSNDSKVELDIAIY